jgi:hypothetical protein
VSEKNLRDRPFKEHLEPLAARAVTAPISTGAGEEGLATKTFETVPLKNN